MSVRPWLSAPVLSFCNRWFCIRRAHTSLLINLHLGIQVDGDDEQIADDVEGAHAVEHVRVFEGDLLADLHHPEDDDQVRSVRGVAISIRSRALGLRGGAYICGLTISAVLLVRSQRGYSGPVQDMRVWGWRRGGRIG